MLVLKNKQEKIVIDSDSKTDSKIFKAKKLLKLEGKSYTHICYFYSVINLFSQSLNISECKPFASNYLKCEGWNKMTTNRIGPTRGSICAKPQKHKGMKYSWVQCSVTVAQNVYVNVARDRAADVSVTRLWKTLNCHTKEFVVDF